jgi:alanyl-tRNA synthetase
MNVSEIRKKFTDFFVSKGHTFVPSSSLIPGTDPTLLFVNSGMVQFKDCFLGVDKRAYTRATSSQRSVRAGGKHNDLENVGYTARHHTFFEMLGNFSFGDYFKRDAIKYAWELLTVVYKLPAEKLWVTVYFEDDEAYDIWANEVGVPKERIVRINDNKGSRYASDNFWMMGDTGPCGPCSEIFYDHGDKVAGGPPGSPEQDGDRYIEIWNLVFMQFNREVKDGEMLPLPKPCVDTGMGLERLSAILQHVHSNYEIDIFQNLIKAAARETGANDLANPSLRVIADHIRACSFLITDGVIPSNEGRGYVLRRIIRRALRHGHKLGQSGLFFHKLVADLDKEMGEAYPELRAAKAQVTSALKTEEERFTETLAHGMGILEKALAGGSKTLDGAVAFQLYDTYGFPLDLTADVCRERGVAVDEVGFTAAMDKQKTQARAAGKFKMDKALTYDGEKTTFHGYDTLTHAGKVVALYKGGVPAAQIAAGDDAIVVLDHTPFYAESGGQVGDQGLISSLPLGGRVPKAGEGGGAGKVDDKANTLSLNPSPPAGGTFLFAVADTQKVVADVFGHHGTLTQGTLKVGDAVNAQVDMIARGKTIRNHSVTHIMHKALREVLGGHVAQKGSLVDADKTRFDFAHNAPMTDAELRKVEAMVNAEIIENTAIHAEVMPFEKAKTSGAMMLFGEKYGDEVRVLEIGTSKEFCGGTHVTRTGDIGFFKFIMETGVAAGVRRVEAVTGVGAVAMVQSLDARSNEVAAMLKSPAALIPEKIAALQEHARSLEKELERLKSKLAAAAGGDLLSKAKVVNGVKMLAAEVEGADAKALREMVEQIKNKMGSGLVLLGSKSADGKVSLCAGVTADLVGTYKAGDIVGKAAAIVGGKGGGKPELAMAGGVDGAKLGEALATLA